MAYRNPWKGRSIRSMMLRILALLCALFLLLCLSVSFGVRHILLKNAEEYQRITAQKLQNQMDMVYDKMEAFALSLSQNEQVIRLMTASDAQRARCVDPVMEAFTECMALEPGIKDIALVNDQVHYSCLYSAERLALFRSEWQGKGFGWWGAIPSSFRALEEKGKRFVYARSLRQKNREIGTLLITFDPAFFQLSMEDGLDSYYVLANDEGPIYSFNCSEDMGQTVFRQWLNHREGASGVFSGWADRVTAGNFPKMQCMLLGTLDLNHISSEMRLIRLLIWLMVALTFLFLSGMFMLIAAQVSKPLQRFRQTIREMRASETVSLPVSCPPEGCEEIQDINREFSALLTEREELNRRIVDSATSLYEAEVARQQAELSFLRSQIDPHFLYNTLEVFRRQASACGAADLADMALDIARIFRYSTKGADLVRLSEEIEMVRAYVHLQKMRFRDRFQAFFSVPEEAMDCVMAKMLLQPIVENAVIHGIEPMETPGAVFIAVKKERDMLILTVKDNGAGIPPEKLRRIQEALGQKNACSAEHVGILNTHTRIRLRYGAPYGVSMESKVGDGTTVILHLPLVTSLN